jgi:hypothetical protein
MAKKTENRAEKENSFSVFFLLINVTNSHLCKEEEEENTRN